MSRIPFLSPLLAPEFPALQFTFSLEPVVQVAARLLAAFNVKSRMRSVSFTLGALDFRSQLKLSRLLYFHLALLSVTYCFLLMEGRYDFTSFVTSTIRNRALPCIMRA
jgi:hypothetical protein